MTTLLLEIDVTPSKDHITPLVEKYTGLEVQGDGDAYEIAPFELALAKGQFDGTLKADLSRKRPRFDLEPGIDEADIRPFFPAGKPVGISAKPRSDSTEKLFSDSPFPRAWMNAADIDARVRIRNLFGQLARSQAKLARINCGVAAFELSGGQTQVRILVDTQDSTTVARGHLDLGAEKLEIRVVPDPKGVHLKVAAPIVVSGSLTEPHYRIEKSGILVSLTDLATKIAVPQVLFADAFSEAIAGNPCVTIATGRFKQQRAGPHKSIDEPVQGGLEGMAAVVQGTGKLIEQADEAVLQGTGGLLKGIGGAAKGLLGGGRRETGDGTDRR